MSDFPLPFAGRPALQGGDLAAHPAFIVASMFTPSHRDLATRLATSLQQLQLPFVIYEVPTVHRSISPRGTDDLAYTKANFIRSVLGEFHTPVLYIDCDCVFRAEPKRIRALVDEGCDFAVYNWLADEHTDAFRPCSAQISGASAETVRSRLFRIAHAVDWYAPDQLLSSGAVQFHANTAGAWTLLEAWGQTIQEFPGAPDDHCLDYAFNFRRPVVRNWHWESLDKAYARYQYWIYVRPVIDHPQFPRLPEREEASIEEERRWRKDNAEVRADARLFPRDAIIDADRRLILRPRKMPGKGFQIEYAPYAPLYHDLFLES
jgi:hypothetical protein